MVEAWGAVATCIAIAGVVLNNCRVRWCFALWLISNALTAGLHLHAGMYSLAARDLVFLGLAVDGWFRWAKRT